jgi:hypothetical protein
VGLQHGGDASDPVDAHQRPPALGRACEGRRAVDLRAPQLRARRHPDDVRAGHRPRHPELHRQPHHPDRPRQPRVPREAREHPTGHDRYRLRAAAREPAGEAPMSPRRPNPRRSISTAMRGS